MDKLLIQGGKRLAGDITISGAKNAALPILCAGLLTAGTLELSNVPKLHDVTTMLKLLGETGLKVTQDDHHVTLNGSAIDKLEAPYDLVKTMRASILVLGPCWRASAKPRSRCRAAAPSVRVRSTSTSRACRRWAPRSPSKPATSTPSAKSSRARASSPT